MQVYTDKLCSGEDRKVLFCSGNEPSENYRIVSKPGSHLIGERIINDIRERINGICSEGSEGIERKISVTEPEPEINNAKSRPAVENKGFVYNTVDEGGKIIPRGITLDDSEFLIKRK
jgi:hypothetical protein